MMGTADYVKTPNTNNVWLDAIMWGTEWSSAGSKTVVSTYIAGQRFNEGVTLSALYTQRVTANAT